jgi:hypothetical protein
METRRPNDEVQLKNLILDIAKQRHPTGKLPNRPWCLKRKSGDRVNSILLEFLTESKHDPNQFAELVTTHILRLNSEIESDLLSKTVETRENIDLRDTISVLSSRKDKQSTMRVIVLEAQGRGDVALNLHLKLGEDQDHYAESGVEVDFTLENDLLLEVDIHQNSNLISSFEENILKHIQLKAPELIISKEKFDYKIDKTGPGFKVNLGIVITLSNRIAKYLLMQKLKESEMRLSYLQTDKDSDYTGLLDALEIEEKDLGFSSKQQKKVEVEIKEGPKEIDRSCDYCSLL